MQLSIDRSYLRETLARLVSIDSVNPDLAEGGAGEAEAAAYASQRLENLGLEIQRFEPRPKRVSVLGRLRGQGTGPSLMLNAHLDTVGVEGMDSPFAAEIRQGRLYGRGAYDMKGSLAACIAAVKALVDAKSSLSGDVLVAAVADEEYASLGTRDLISHCIPDAAIVTEPSELQICLAHKGFVWLEVETRGRAYHGSQFGKGIDANMLMGRFLARLDRFEKSLRQRPPHPLVGPPSLHAAMIQGGTSMSVYSAACRLGIERRTVPGESVKQVESEIRRLIAEQRDSDPVFEADLRVTLCRDPFEVSPEAKVVESLGKAYRQVRGEDAQFGGQNPWMDSALLAAAGVETVVIGPSGAGAHSDEEWVDLESLDRLAAILAHAAQDYCGGDG